MTSTELLDRLYAPVLHGKLLREQIEAREKEARRFDALGVDATTVRQDIEAKRAEMRGVEAEVEAAVREYTTLPSREREAAPPAEKPPKNGHAHRSAPLARGQRVVGSAPERVLVRMTAEPHRVFTPPDFADLGLPDKQIWNALHRLSSEESAVDRLSKGRYRLRDQSITAAPVAELPAPTAGSKVLTFMQQHPGAWMRAAEVTKGMGLDPDRKGAIAASLSRLAPKHLQKKGGTYCFPSVTRQGRGDLEVAGR